MNALTLLVCLNGMSTTNAKKAYTLLTPDIHTIVYVTWFYTNFVLGTYNKHRKLFLEQKYVCFGNMCCLGNPGTCVCVCVRVCIHSLPARVAFTCPCLYVPAGAVRQMRSWAYGMCTHSGVCMPMVFVFTYCMQV